MSEREELARIALADGRRLGDLLNHADLANIEAWMTEVGVELYAAEAGYRNLPPVEDAKVAELLALADDVDGRRTSRDTWPRTAKLVADLATLARSLMAQRDDYKDDYFRRHKEAADNAIRAMTAEARAEAAEQRERVLRERLTAWEECALYDATMEGPVFKGWNRSALDRCRQLPALATEKTT